MTLKLVEVINFLSEYWPYWLNVLLDDQIAWCKTFRNVNSETPL